jgi:hypothetical protein
VEPNLAVDCDSGTLVGGKMSFIMFAVPFPSFLATRS